MQIKSATSKSDHGLAQLLLRWFALHGRQLPWRAQAQRDPYKVWLSEIMLQQTTVAAATPYFLRFLKKWPDVHALAYARRDSVLRAWAGLGYYARARNLHQTARIIAREKNGVFPEARTDLLALPGIGPYTASAIAAIAFRKCEVAIDGNVLRVMSRFLANSSSGAQLSKHAQNFLRKIIPRQQPGDFCEALMDLGATVCRPKNPNCLICPWNAQCKAFASKQVDHFPVRNRKKTRPLRRMTVYWIEKDDLVLVRRREDKGLFGGMLELPCQTMASAKTRHPFSARWERVPGTIAHTLSHFDLELRLLRARVDSVPKNTRGFWLKKNRLLDYAFPAAMKKIIKKVLVSQS